MPAPVGDCSTPPRGYLFLESGESALTGRQSERPVLADALVGESLLPFGVSYATSPSRCTRPAAHIPIRVGCALTYQAKSGSSQRQSASSVLKVLQNS